ncbi:MAG: hypothetical protein HFACDABA_02042 [Anaerolineales bacterium]|nr:hypothetical protein [Anaerolineales bacterium]
MKSDLPNTLTNANQLCVECGLCCTGHLFTHLTLKPGEEAKADFLGLEHSDPAAKIRLVFPCHLWNGNCSIYAHPSKPNICDAYQCGLLKKVTAQQVDLPEALKAVRQIKQVISELEPMLEGKPDQAFLKRLIDQVSSLESSGHGNADELNFRLKAGVVLVLFKKYFDRREFKAQRPVSNEESIP